MCHADQSCVGHPVLHCTVLYLHSTVLYCCSEAANLRHMPEGLWFFFWTMAHSPAMEALWMAGQPSLEPQDGRKRRVALRNQMQVGGRAGAPVWSACLASHAHAHARPGGPPPLPASPLKAIKVTRAMPD